MNVIKRSGSEAKFNVEKIYNAIIKANNSVEENKRLSEEKVSEIAKMVEKECKKRKRASTVEEIQDLVEKAIMQSGYYEVAKNYITYRYTRELVRKSNTTDDQILIKTQYAIPFKEIRWLEKYQKIFLNVYYYLAIFLKLTQRELYISMIWIILLNICITVIW